MHFLKIKDKKMEKLFFVDNMSFGYTNEIILDKISFAVCKGDFIGLIGNNGSGKTTLLKLLLGQLKPTGGQIVKSENIKIGYVEQVTLSSDRSFPASVEEIVLLGLYKKIGFFRFAKKSHRKLVSAALKTVGLAGYEKRQINQLSGGQQQKILIAKTLVENPDILILDEPTTGIDKESEQDFFKLLEHLNKEHKKTILIVTHSIEKVLNTNKLYRIDNKTLKEEKHVKI